MLIKILNRLIKSNKKNIKLKKYDIVYTNMKILEIILGNINEKHDKRPFLITKVGIRKISGYYMTSNLDNTYFKNKTNLKFILLKSKYNLKKDGLVLYNKKIKIPKKYVIHYIDKLKKDDLKKLKKYKKRLKTML